MIFWLAIGSTFLMSAVLVADVVWSWFKERRASTWWKRL